MTFLHLVVMLFIVGAVPFLAQGERTGPIPVEAASVSTCGPHRQTVVDLADRIISEKHLAEGFSGRNFGTTAAYLKLRYQDLGLTEGLALLEAVEAGARRGPRLLDDVRLAFAISHQGVEKGLRANGDSTLAAFAKHQSILPRQMVLADGGVSYFRLLAELRRDPERVEEFDRAYGNGVILPLLLLDQDDAFKLDFATRAEAAGELLMAGLALGSRSDLSAHHAFLQRHGDSGAALGAGPLDIDRFLMTMRYQTRPQTLPTDDAERRAYRRELFDVSRATYQIGGFGWPMILLNQTGDGPPIMAASQDFLAALERGLVQPERDMDGAWAYLHSRLALEMGADALVSALRAFVVPRSVRHYAKDAADVLNWMQATVALSDFVQGGPEPERPAMLTADFQWSTWVRIAEGLRRNGAASLTSAEPMDVRIGIELLYRAGEVETAIDLAAKVMPNTDRLWIYRDLMQRLDQRCNGFTYYAGGGLALAGQVPFWFDPR